MNIQFTQKQFLIKDVVCMWASVQQPKPKYKATNGEKEFSIELLVSEDIVDQLEANNINKKPASCKDKNKKAIKKGKEAPYSSELEDLYSLKLTSLSTWQDGKPKEIKVVKDKKPFKDNIGNGSVVDVIATIGKANSDGLHTVYLQAVNVKELVEYEAGDSLDFETDDDFGDDDIDFS